MNESLQAVIFDMDGVLVDSEPLQLRSINKILSDYGATLTEEAFTHFVGTTQLETFTTLKERFALPGTIDDLIAKKRTAYAKLVEDELCAMPGLYSLIANLKTADLKSGVASSSPMQDIQTVLRKIDLENSFDAVFSSVGLPHGKPHPDVFLLTAQTLRVAPQNCIVIEDSGVGVQAAKRAGMRCIAMPNIFTQHQDFSIADFVVGNLFEVRGLIQTKD